MSHHYFFAPRLTHFGRTIRPPGDLSPIHGVRFSSGKKQCVFKEEDYKKHKDPNRVNLTFIRFREASDVTCVVEIIVLHVSMYLMCISANTLDWWTCDRVIGPSCIS